MSEYVEKITGVLAVVIVIGAIGLSAFGLEVPAQLWTAFSVVLGFFFGTVTTGIRLRAR